MAEATKSHKERAGAGKKEVTFRCRFCGRDMPIKEMMVISRFFPPQIACKECERLLG